MGGSVGRGMAIAALDLNGNEAKAYGLADHLVLGSRMEHLKEMMLDAVVEGQEDNTIESVLKGSPLNLRPLVMPKRNTTLSLEPLCRSLTCWRRSRLARIKKVPWLLVPTRR